MKKRSCRRNGGVVTEDQKALQIQTVSHQFCLMDLPIAVLYVILFRLPIKSIMVLKFVCRALHKLVSNPNFAVNYTKNSPFATFLFPNDVRNPRPKHLYLLEISDTSEYMRTKFRPKIPDWSKRSSIISIVFGSCNGLFCFSISRMQTQTVYICNPITGECISLPKHRIKRGEDCVVDYGFGFCRSTNKYKVLRIVNKYKKPVEGHFEIFTIGVDDRWRVLDLETNLTFPVYLNLPGLFSFNETLHWITMDVRSPLISTFDFGEEKIGRLSHPHGLELDFMCMNLTSVNNQLCLVAPSRNEFVIWKMKQYGVAESWIKDLVLDLSVLPKMQMQLRRLSLVRILENGDMLFCNPRVDYTISYSPTKKELTRIRVPCFGSIDYSPNFLSLKEIITGGHSSTIKGVIEVIQTLVPSGASSVSSEICPEKAAGER